MAAAATQVSRRFTRNNEVLKTHFRVRAHGKLCNFGLRFHSPPCRAPPRGNYAWVSGNGAIVTGNTLADTGCKHARELARTSVCALMRHVCHVPVTVC